MITARTCFAGHFDMLHASVPLLLDRNAIYWFTRFAIRPEPRQLLDRLDNVLKVGTTNDQFIL